VTPRILIVDNDPELVNLLQGHLAREGWTTASATSGADAVGALGRKD
jgi:CheY-like chemotaxis protein